MLNAIAGADRHDATAAAVPVPDYLAEAGKRGQRPAHRPFTGLFPHHFPGRAIPVTIMNKKLPEEIEQAVVLRRLEMYQALGAEIIEDVPMPNTRYGIPAYFVISRVEAASNLHRFDGVKYGYRTKTRSADLNDMYRRSRGEGIWLAAQTAHPDGHVCQRGAVQRTVLPPGAAGAHA